MENILEFLGIALVVFSSFTIIKANLGFAPWVPTYRKDLARIFELFSYGQSKYFLDLGCGNGRVVIESLKYGYKARGVELSLPLYLYCLVLSLFKGDKDLKFYFGDLFKFNVREADLIYVYAVPAHLTQKFVQKIIAEAKSGSTLISYCFMLPGIHCEKVVRDDANHLPLYIYKF
ncbi:MAG: class I SAM-dependent methyltransferase [bacterium]